MELEAVDKGAVRLSVPTRFLRNWIQSHYSEKVLGNWQAEESVDHPPGIERPLGRDPAGRRSSRKRAGDRCARARDARSATQRRRRARHERAVHDRCTKRSAARRSIRACRSTASSSAARTRWRTRRPSRSPTSRRGEPLMFNPLYIHAGVGLGKTHLLQAITWAGNGSDRKVLYLTAERFMYGFVSALRTPDHARLQGSGARHRRADHRRPAIPAGPLDPGRVLPHAQCADRRRPPGGDRQRPAAGRPRKPRRPRALAARRRPRGRDRLARRGIAARNPQEPDRRRLHPSSRLRSAGAGAGLHRQVGDP